MKKLVFSCGIVDDKITNTRDMLIEVNSKTKLIVPTIIIDYNTEEAEKIVACIKAVTDELLCKS